MTLMGYTEDDALDWMKNLAKAHQQITDPVIKASIMSAIGFLDGLIIEGRMI